MYGPVHSLRDLCTRERRVIRQLRLLRHAISPAQRRHPMSAKAKADLAGEMVVTMGVVVILMTMV
jgi:hypothetical protein